MTYTIRAVDSILDYDRDLMEQMKRLEAFYGPGFQQGDPHKFGRYRCDGFGRGRGVSGTTIWDVRRYGRLWSTGRGMARRYSKTLGKTMLYVACRSDYSDMVLRLAVPYSGIQEYLPMLFRQPS